MTWPNNNFSARGNISAARFRYPGGGNPSPSSGWERFIFLVILLLVVFLIWLLVEGRKQKKKKKKTD
ncbi:hypothetical protein [endosymbiont DhMRE of Dentiscutata heterogama]|uniref:hypothetical protein n=1 Tax=endosymbiont DhMRE of Dentiscutata heterogama TaxID=1609546 RepID=UPI002AD481E1|nr:hypothetical protein [endosymbiont DhMRE of Dentiscutata heterogama]